MGTLEEKVRSGDVTETPWCRGRSSGAAGDGGVLRAWVMVKQTYESQVDQDDDRLAPHKIPNLLLSSGPLSRHCSFPTPIFICSHPLTNESDTSKTLRQLAPSWVPLPCHITNHSKTRTGGGDYPSTGRFPLKGADLGGKDGSDFFVQHGESTGRLSPNASAKPTCLELRPRE